MAKKDTPAKATKAKTEPKKPSLITDNSVLKIVIPQKQAKQAYKNALSNLAKNVKASGFRKGHVPLEMAASKLGREEIVNAALNKILPKLYVEALKKSGKTPITQPDFKPVKVDEKSDWEVEAHFAEKPEVTLGNYKKIISDAKKQAKKDKKTKDDDVLHAIFTALITEIKPKIQEILVREQTSHEIQHLAQNLKQMNVTFEDYLKRRGMSFQTLSQQLAAQALGQLQLEFILQAITDEEKIDVTEQEIEAEFKKAVPDFKGKMPENAVPNIKLYLQRNKVFQSLLKA